MCAGGANIPADLQEEGVWYGLFTDAMGIGYNHSKVSPEEEKLIETGGWDALTDPRWKGRFGTATPASGGSSYAFCYMFLVTLRDQYGPAFFKKEAANKPDIYASKARCSSGWRPASTRSWTRARSTRSAPII